MSWQDRLVEEHADLTDKIDKLNRFMGSAFFDTLATEDRLDLHSQARYMLGYHTTLERRIARLEPWR